MTSSETNGLKVGDREQYKKHLSQLLLDLRGEKSIFDYINFTWISFIYMKIFCRGEKYIVLALFQVPTCLLV